MNLVHSMLPSFTMNLLVNTTFEINRDCWELKRTVIQEACSGIQCLIFNCNYQSFNSPVSWLLELET